MLNGGDGRGRLVHVRLIKVRTVGLEGLKLQERVVHQGDFFPGRRSLYRCT